MKNLQKFGIQELNIEEVNAINGGSWFSDVVECHGLLIGYVTGEIASLPGKWIQSLEDGFNAAF